MFSNEVLQQHRRTNTRILNESAKKPSVGVIGTVAPAQERRKDIGK